MYTYRVSYRILYFNNGLNFRMGRFPDASSYVCKSLGLQGFEFQLYYNTDMMMTKYLGLDHICQSFATIVLKFSSFFLTKFLRMTQVFNWTPIYFIHVSVLISYLGNGRQWGVQLGSQLVYQMVRTTLIWASLKCKGTDVFGVQNTV